MNNKIILFSLLLISATCFAQTDDCDRANTNKIAKNQKTDIESKIKQIKNSKKKISDDDLKKIKADYTVLADSFNLIYGLVRDDIKKGLSFVGVGRICKKAYYPSLKDEFKKAHDFSSRLDNVIQGQPYSENTKGGNFLDILLKIITWLEQLFKGLQGKADEMGNTFYESAHWKAFDDIK